MCKIEQSASQSKPDGQKPVGLGTIYGHNANYDTIFRTMLFDFVDPGNNFYFWFENQDWNQDFLHFWLFSTDF